MMSFLSSNLLLLMLLFSFGLQAVPVSANDAKPVATASKNAALEEILDSIKQQRTAIQLVQKQAATSDGLAKKIFEVRLDKAWMRLLELGLSFSETVATKQADEKDVGKYQQQAVQILGSQIEVANILITRLRKQMKIPNSEDSAAVQAAALSRVFTLQDSLNLTYEQLVKSLALSRQFNIDVSAHEESLMATLTERAVNLSILLEMMMGEVTALRASAAAVPDDAELKAKLVVASGSIDNLAKGLTAILEMMDSLGMDTNLYQEQVINMTGEVTSDLLEVGVLTSLLIGWGQTLWNVMIEDGPDLLFKILLFFIIIYVFYKLSKVIQKLVENGLKKAQLQLSELLRRMVVSIVRNIIMVLGFLIALSQVGISLGPLLAGLGVVGFVIGFALQDTLSNFASGLMILLYRPYDVGDLIESAGELGHVRHMSLVNTTIMTFDNQTIILPNNKIWRDVIKNVTAQSSRRVDMVFGISYDDDIPKAELVLQEILSSHELVLSSPEPIVRLHELADSSVNFVARPWVKKDDYWDVYWDVTRSVKMRFDEEGISIPFPQQDVHIYKEYSTP